MEDITFSDYYKTLDNEHANRYRKKVAIINIDPYLIKPSECSDKVENYPNILYPDIVNYLLFNKSAYTQQQIKAYKGLEAYKQASCGWVQNVYTKRCADKIVILGNVLHSQQVNKKHTNSWIIAELGGEVLCAHCDCVAGLGETCTHVCAIMFYIDGYLRRSTETSVTDSKSTWVIPRKIAAPDKIANIEFTTPSKKCLINMPIYNRNVQQKARSLSNSEICEVLSKLELGTSGLHAVVKPFSVRLREELQVTEKYTLSTLYQPEYEIESLENLQRIGSNLNIDIPIEECRKIEKATNQQANSAAWYRYRAGRITASKFKSVCKTKLDKPSLSLLKSICYPLASRFKTTATIYGCNHEKEALQAYIREMEKNHEDFGGEAVGLCLNPKYPQFGASPDGLVSCECCGLGVVEIKCPFCAKDIGIEDLKVLQSVGMKAINGKLQLDNKHPYYYQIQMQLAITGVNYCDFVVWSNKNFCYERILFNGEFWQRESAIALEFFKKVVIPELLGKYYTNKNLENCAAENDWHVFKCSLGDHERNLTFDEIAISGTMKPSSSFVDTNESVVVNSSNLYCLCNGPDDGTPMIACDNTKCSVEWYHLACVNLTSVPTTQWYCHFCKH